MATLTADEWQSLMDIADADVSNTIVEYILNTAIDTANALGNSLGVEITNMTGSTAGSKTWSGTSAEKGVILNVARLIYYGFYQDLEQATLAGITVIPADILSNPNNLNFVKELVMNLREIDVSVG